jgi:hypothetical protein
MAIDNGLTPMTADVISRFVGADSGNFHEMAPFRDETQIRAYWRDVEFFSRCQISEKAFSTIEFDDENYHPSFSDFLKSQKHASDALDQRSGIK